MLAPLVSMAAVHRVGKPRLGSSARPRPTIARFISREHRDLVFKCKNQGTRTLISHKIIQEEYKRKISYDTSNEKG